MNALWITRFCAYKNTPLALGSAKTLIEVKIDRRVKLLRKFIKAVDHKEPFRPLTLPARNESRCS